MDRTPLRPGNTRPEQFYTLTNAAEIVRVKFKSLLIIAVYSTMIVGLPLVAGFTGRLIRCRPERPGRDVDLLVATVLAVFVLATLKRIPDVTQVAQLGRYYLPVFLLALPTAVAGVLAWLRSETGPPQSVGLAGRRLRRPGLGRPDLGL